MHIYSFKIAGVTFGNRQDALKRLCLMAVRSATKVPVRVLKQDENKFDQYCLSIEAEIDGRWEELGYVPKEINQMIRQYMDDGKLNRVWLGPIAIIYIPFYSANLVCEINDE